MVEVNIGCQRNIANPNSDRMRSSYEAEEVEEVKGSKAASWGGKGGGRGYSKSSLNPSWTRSITVGLDRRRTMILSSIWLKI